MVRQWQDAFFEHRRMASEYPWIPEFDMLAEAFGARGFRLETYDDVGETLEDDSGITEEIVDDLDATAWNEGRLGHAAKTARARNDDFEPIILRRSEGVNNAFHRDGVVGFNFTAAAESMADFVETRRAMNAADLEEHVEADDNGLLSFIEVTNRATFLLPPRRHRALPTPRPDG
jgi:hypothetical protein